MKLLSLIAITLLCGGCFVFDEIEAGQEIMEAHSPGTKEAAVEDDGTPKSARDKLNSYYAKQRAKASAPTKSEDASDKLGQCRIGGRTNFMRRSDCQTRGGKFL